eukprot:c41971_g1_i1 orf=2-223(-)
MGRPVLEKGSLLSPVTLSKIRAPTFPSHTPSCFLYLVQFLVLVSACIDMRHEGIDCSICFIQVYCVIKGLLSQL